MNLKKLIATVTVLAAAGSAFAADLTENTNSGAPAPKTRAQVIAELEQSKRDGSYELMHQEYPGQFPQAAVQYARSQAEKNNLARNGKAVDGTVRD